MKRSQILTLQKFITKKELRFKKKFKHDFIISFHNTFSHYK